MESWPSGLRQLTANEQIMINDSEVQILHSPHIKTLAIV